ncbi:MAG: hypothetical protein AAB847_02570 [Patescibacteria group bacterium]
MKCENNGGKMHWYCCVKPMLGGVLWVAAAIALIAAWMASSSDIGLVYGRDELHWYLDAIVLAVLALGCKIHCGRGDGCGMCGTNKE